MSDSYVVLCRHEHPKATERGTIECETCGSPLPAAPLTMPVNWLIRAEIEAKYGRIPKGKG